MYSHLTAPSLLIEFDWWWSVNFITWNTLRQLRLVSHQHQRCLELEPWRASVGYLIHGISQFGAGWLATLHHQKNTAMHLYTSETFCTRSRLPHLYILTMIFFVKDTARKNGGQVGPLCGSDPDPERLGNMKPDDAPETPHLCACNGFVFESHFKCVVLSRPCFPVFICTSLQTRNQCRQGPNR